MIVVFFYCYAWSSDGLCDASAKWTFRFEEWVEKPCEEAVPEDQLQYLVSCEKRRDGEA